MRKFTSLFLVLGLIILSGCYEDHYSNTRVVPGPNYYNNHIGYPVHPVEPYRVEPVHPYAVHPYAHPIHPNYPNNFNHSNSYHYNH